MSCLGFLNMISKVWSKLGVARTQQHVRASTVHALRSMICSALSKPQPLISMCRCHSVFRAWSGIPIAKTNCYYFISTMERLVAPSPICANLTRLRCLIVFQRFLLARKNNNWTR